jgi:hypothetical protein
MDTTKNYPARFSQNRRASKSRKVKTSVYQVDVLCDVRFDAAHDRRDAQGDLPLRDVRDILEQAKPSRKAFLEAALKCPVTASSSHPTKLSQPTEIIT